MHLITGWMLDKSYGRLSAETAQVPAAGICCTVLSAVLHSAVLLLTRAHQHSFQGLISKIKPSRS